MQIRRAGPLPDVKRAASLSPEVTRRAPNVMKLGTGPTIGIIAGAAVLGVALLALVGLMLLRWRRSKANRPTRKLTVYPGGNRSLEFLGSSALRRFREGSSWMPSSRPASSECTMPVSSPKSADILVRGGSNNHQLVSHDQAKTARPAFMSWTMLRRSSSRKSADVIHPKSMRQLSSAERAPMTRSKTSPALTTSGDAATISEPQSESKVAVLKSPSLGTVLSEKTTPNLDDTREQSWSTAVTSQQPLRAWLAEERRSPGPTPLSESTHAPPPPQVQHVSQRQQTPAGSNRSGAGRPGSWLGAQDVGATPQAPLPPLGYGTAEMRRDGQQRRSARLSHASLKSISSISSVSSSVLNDIIPKRQAHAQADMGGQTNRLSIQLLSSARSSRTSDGLSILERGSIAGEIPHPIGLSSPSKRRVQSLQRRTLSRDTSGNVISVRVDCQPVDRDRIVGDSSRISIGTLGGRRQSHPLPAHVLTYNADEQRSPDQSSPTGRVPATPPSTPEDAIPNHQALLRHGSNASYASAASSATHEVTPLSASWTMALRDVAGNRRDYSPSTPSLQRSPIKPHSGQSLDFWDPSIQIQSKRPISAFKGSSLRSTVHKRRKCVRISSQAPTIHHALPAPPSSEKSLASPKSPRPEASPEGATSLEGRPLPRPPSINTFDPVFAASPPHPSLSFMETRQMVNPSGAPASPRHHHYHSSPALLRTSQDELTAARETLIRRSSTASSVLSSPPLSRRDSPLSLSPGFLAVFPAVPRVSTTLDSSPATKLPCQTFYSAASHLSQVAGDEGSSPGSRVQGPRTPPFQRYSRSRHGSAKGRSYPTHAHTHAHTHVHSQSAIPTPTRYSAETRYEATKPSLASPHVQWNGSGRRRQHILIGSSETGSPTRRRGTLTTSTMPTTPTMSHAISRSAPVQNTGRATPVQNRGRTTVAQRTGRTTPAMAPTPRTTASPSPSSSSMAAALRRTSTDSTATLIADTQPRQIHSVRDSRNFAMPVPRSVHGGGRIIYSSMSVRGSPSSPLSPTLGTNIAVTDAIGGISRMHFAAGVADPGTSPATRPGNMGRNDSTRAGNTGSIVSDGSETSGGHVASGLVGTNLSAVSRPPGLSLTPCGIISMYEEEEEACDAGAGLYDGKGFLRG